MKAKNLIALLMICFLQGNASAQEYIGRAEATQTVQLHPEISARITRVQFAEGSFVKEGATLFTLNPAQFQAQVQLRKAQLAHAQAVLDGAKKYLARIKTADRRSVPASDIDTADSEVKQAQAQVAEAKAELKLAQIDLNNTRVYAPISGYIGRAEFTRGNYVSPENVLASIVQTDPARISFGMTDREYLANKDKAAEYILTLADGSTYPHKAELDFTSTTMDPETGTITIFLRVPNENHTIIPGAIIRVNVTYPSGD